MKPSLDYLAGLFDGEGWFYLSKSRRKDIKRDYAFQIHAGLVMREQALVRLFQERFGGTIRAQKPRKVEHSVTYKWRVTGNGVSRLCREMGSLLIAKRAQAELALDFQEKKQRQGNRPISDEHYLECLDYYSQMRSLNEKGRGKDM